MFPRYPFYRHYFIMWECRSILAVRCIWESSKNWLICVSKCHNRRKNQAPHGYVRFYCILIWTASSEFGTYRLCEQRRFRRVCASAQSRQNRRCSLIQAVSEEERQKARSLAPLNGWACAVKICHDGMVADTNSLDGAHLRKVWAINALMPIIHSLWPESVYLHMFLESHLLPTSESTNTLAK